MKSIGTIQFQQKKFKFLDLDPKWKDTFGNMPETFIVVIMGESGNGKTEGCVQFLKHLTRFAKAGWVSYEQGHGSDLQMAINRNKMEEVSGKVTWYDPHEKHDPNKSYFQELDEAIGKKSSPKYWFIDSLDYTRLTWEQYAYLKQKYGKKKGIVFIAHARGNKAKRTITEEIGFDGGYIMLVKNYIMRVLKSRFGGNKPLVLWEEEARLREPKFFKN